MSVERKQTLNQKQWVQPCPRLEIKSGLVTKQNKNYSPQTTLINHSPKQQKMQKDIS